MRVTLYSLVMPLLGCITLLTWVGGWVGVEGRDGAVGSGPSSSSSTWHTCPFFKKISTLEVCIQSFDCQQADSRAGKARNCTAGRASGRQAAANTAHLCAQSPSFVTKMSPTDCTSSRPTVKSRGGRPAGAPPSCDRRAARCRQPASHSSNRSMTRRPSPPSSCSDLLLRKCGGVGAAWLGACGAGGWGGAGCGAHMRCSCFRRAAPRSFQPAAMLLLPAPAAQPGPPADVALGLVQRKVKLALAACCRCRADVAATYRHLRWGQVGQGGGRGGARCSASGVPQADVLADCNVGHVACRAAATLQRRPAT